MQRPSRVNPIVSVIYYSLIWCSSRALLANTADPPHGPDATLKAAILDVVRNVCTMPADHSRQYFELLNDMIVAAFPFGAATPADTTNERSEKNLRWLSSLLLLVESGILP